MRRHKEPKNDQARIERLFEALEPDGPGVSVGVARGGVPVFRGGFGLASLGRGEPLSASVPMRIGSTSKHFACLAFLLLCEEGRSDLDAPVPRSLGLAGKTSDGVRIRDLMTHLSGLRDIYDFAWQFGDDARSLDRPTLLDCTRAFTDRNERPGTRWRYNNGAYLLLGAIIEEIAGEPLEELLRLRVFEPAGLLETKLCRSHHDVPPVSASVHVPMGGGLVEGRSLGADLDMAGGLISSVDDLLRWLQHMRSPRIGSRASWNIMTQTASTALGAPTGYGLGLMTGRYRGRRIIHHPGGVLGGNCQMLMLPDDDLDVVVISNRHDLNAPALALRILDVLLDDSEPSPETDCEPLGEGDFVSPGTGRVVQLRAEGGRQIVAIDGFDLPFERRGRTLRPSATHDYLKQAVTLEGEPAAAGAMTLEDFGCSDRLVRLPGPPARTQLYEGRYRYGPLGIDLHVAWDKGEALLVSDGPFGSARYRLDPLGGPVWRADSHGPMPWGGTVTFGDRGRCLHYTTPRSWAVPFGRMP